MSYATSADVQNYLPQFVVGGTTKPSLTQLTSTGLPDSEAEFAGRVKAIEFKLGVTFPITATAFTSWAKFVVSLMAAAWVLETRTAAIGGDPAFQSAEYYRQRVNEQFALLEEGKIAFDDPAAEEEIPEAVGFIRGGPVDTDPRATISYYRPHRREF